MTLRKNLNLMKRPKGFLDNNLIFAALLGFTMFIGLGLWASVIHRDVETTGVETPDERAARYTQEDRAALREHVKTLLDK